MAFNPKYRMIIEYVIDKINSKALKSGDRIPSEKEFSDMFGVSNITVRKAMSELVNSGVVYRVKGKGSYVSAHASQKENRTSKLVVFLCSGFSINENAYMQFMLSIQNCLLEHGYSLIIENVDNDKRDEFQVIKELIEKHVEGFIIISKDPEKSILSYEYLHNNNIPFVLIDRYTPLFPVNYVGSNNHDGAFSSVMHLLELNHTGIAFVSQYFNLSSEAERYSGYCDAFSIKGLSANPDYLFKNDNADIERLISYIKTGKITAIAASNDRCALDVMNSLKQAGIRVPDDVSIVGFDDSDIINQAMIPLTTVKQFFSDIGRTAANLLIENINSDQRDYTHIKIGTRLIIRKSTRPL
ncbi:MAG TPA: GntR family transcriptional regulator [Clostridiaceae bacterium]|nr:GntR family transcriptional regulator [Clostridiaceae bacterium]